MLSPDPKWGTTVNVLPTDLMEARVEEELAAWLGGRPPISGPALPRHSDCAKANAELLDAAAGRLVKLVRAPVSSGTAGQFPRRAPAKS
ncbi:hypothetical protein ACFQZ8_04675 [Micromonospora azadirachtae]|uniref:Uncharacterized protein n=1 Tax=Micromonospora azadirachtae TaxID=1970735 RepID=A0ABW2ZX25_9ACTN